MDGQSLFLILGHYHFTRELVLGVKKGLFPQLPCIMQGSRRTTKHIISTPRSLWEVLLWETTNPAMGPMGWPQFISSQASVL